MKVIYNGRPKTYMTEISESDVWYVCGWLRSFIRDIEGSVRELSIAYIENLNVEDVNGMVVRDVQRRYPDRGYVQQNIRDWPLTGQLRRVIGALSTRNGNQQDTHVRDLMIAEIEHTRPRTGPPGPKSFEVVYPPPGASGCSMYRQMLLSRLCSFIV
jgi:hypothetical protein